MNIPAPMMTCTIIVYMAAVTVYSIGYGVCYVFFQLSEIVKAIRGISQISRIPTLMKPSIGVFMHTQKAWRYWLSRRCNKGWINVEKFKQLKERFPLPMPKIFHNI